MIMTKQGLAMTRKFHRGTKKFRNAFTLIELLVVISIIALLIGLLLPALSRARRSARVTQCLGNLHNITTGCANYSSEFGGVIATGDPPEIKTTNSAGPRMGTKPAYYPNRNGRNFGGWNADIQYWFFNRYWFYGLAPWIAQEDEQKSVYADVFFCPDDVIYREKAREIRTTETNQIRTLFPNSYAMSDTTLWSPQMFTEQNVTQILAENQMSENGPGAVARQDTPGRRYQQTSNVRFPSKKVYFYEHGSFHEKENVGWNAPGIKATIAFFDGHGVFANAAGQALEPLMKTYAPRLDRIVEEIPWWYYGSTRDGINGRDFE